MSQSPDPENPLRQNSFEARTLRKRSTKEKLVNDYPSFVLRDQNPLSKTGANLTKRGEVLQKLGLVERDVVNVPKITNKIRAGWGSTEEAIEILASDESPESLRFMEKWNSLTPPQRANCHLEDVMTAAGLTGRKFIELLAGATVDHDDFVSKIYKSRKKLRVLESTFKAATDEVPILDRDGEVVGASNGDVKAQELFFKLTGDIKPTNMMINSGNQTANINTPSPERDPLQSMDRFLLEIEEVRKPKQLSSPPVIPVEMPANAPEIEYLDLEG